MANHAHKSDFEETHPIFSRCKHERSHSQAHDRTHVAKMELDALQPQSQERGI